MPLITQEYKELIKEVHETTGGWGVTGSGKFFPRIVTLVKHFKPKTFLDYGSGAGRLKLKLEEKFPKLKIYEYEPAHEELAGPGWPSDVVVCIDVLEHVEPECIEDVLIDLSRCTLNIAYVTVAYYKASRVLPDGRNAHILLKDHSWWKEKLSKHFNILNCKEEEKTGIFLLKSK